MARIGRFEKVVTDTSGNGIGSVSVEIRKQGATVNGDQSGTSPLTITVNDPGAITSADNVVVDTGTTTFAVDSVTATTVVVSGFGGTLAVTDDQRLSPTTNLPSLFNDALSVEALSNPLTTASSGQVGLANGWVVGGYYDIHVSGGSPTAVNTALQEDTFVFGESNVSNAFDSATQDGWIWDTAALTTAGAVHTSFKIDGTEIFRIDKDGDIFTSSGVLVSNVADGASAIAFDLDADTALSTSGAKLLRITNNSVEKFSLDKDGKVAALTSVDAIIDASFVVGHTAQVAFGEVTSEAQILGTTETDSSIAIGLFSETNALAPILKLMKSGNATIGSNTIVVDGEELGKIQFYGDDGVDHDTLSAEIACNVDASGSIGAGVIPSEIILKTSLASGSLTTGFILNEFQDVTIGPTSGAARLNVNSNNTLAAEPVARLTQGDIDEGFIDYVGTSAADGSRSISSDTTEDDAKFGAIRCEINGVTKWIRVYDGHS